MPYLSLIDTVTYIVDKYGEGTLTTKRFWNILSDLYDFSHENPLLKQSFREIIDNGCINHILAYKGKQKIVRDYIENYVSRQANAGVDNRDYYSAALFSIAIALKVFNKNDYVSFCSRNYPLPNSSRTPNSRQKSKPHRNISNTWLKVKGFIKKIFELIGLNVLPFIVHAQNKCAFLND